MEKRALLALGLSALILIGWLYLFPPPKSTPSREPLAPPQESPAAPAPAPAVETKPAAEPGAAAPKAAVAAEAIEEVRVSTQRFEVVLTNKGGRVVSWRLKDYTDSQGGPLELVPAYSVRDDRLPAALDLDDAPLADRINRALFKVVRSPSDDPRGPGQRIVMSWSDGSGIEAVKTFAFRDADWIVDLDVQVTDRGRRLPARIAWGPGFEARDPDKGSRQFHYTGQAVRDEGGAVTRLRSASVKQEIAIPETGMLRWAGLEEQFFAALVIPAGGKGQVVIRPEPILPDVPPATPQGDKAPKPETQLLVAVGVPSDGAKLFVGPKKFTLLRGLGHDLDAVIWFSSYSLIYWLAKYLFLALLWTHDRLAPNYGLAIIAATVVLRLVFFPLNQYSMVNMRKMQTQMQRIQPKINAIKTKYRKIKDAEGRRKMNEEMMALYRREGVNPMGGMSGCLPMVVQLPILYAFYNVLTVAVELRGAPFFGWIRDLTLKDPYYVTPLMMGATMFVQQKMTASKGGDPVQQRMMLMMPVVFTVMFLNLPSGLVLYWFVNNLLGIAQQWLVNRHIGRLEAAATKA